MYIKNWILGIIKEVEIRVKIDSLEAEGFVFAEKEIQDDTYFKYKDHVDKVQEAGDFILRVRESWGGDKLTFKALTETVGSWDEHETRISDPEETKSMLLKSGFVRNLEVHKERQKATLNGITVCLDDIATLGTFIEMEVVCDDVQEGKKQLLSLAKELGFNDSDIVHKGYAAILFERQGVKYKNTG